MAAAQPTPPAFVGQRRSYDGALCTVRYIGEVAGTAGGTWLGVEWDDPTRGKHDGVHKGVRYFACSQRSRPPPVVLVGDVQHPALATGPLTPASFVRPTRRADAPRTFLEAVRAKYASEATTDTDTAGGDGKTVLGGAVPGRQIVISGKVAEEVGFDKVRRQLAQIETLRVVILDGQCVVSEGEGEGPNPNAASQIQTTCPSITELDLSRNLFTDFATVAVVCRELPRLRGLRVNGNRVTVAEGRAYAGSFDGVRELAVEETYLSWAALGHLTANFPLLASLAAGSNQLTNLTPALPTASLATTLTTLNLEFNDFTALSDLANLSALAALRNLHLKGCRIAQVAADPERPPAFAFSPTLTYVDLSYNLVTSWAFVDALPDVFPGMVSLRFAHNPIYNNPNLDVASAAAMIPAATTTTTTTTPATGASAGTATTTTASTEESYMVAVGRLARLRTLNFSTISPTDRANAEMFYLSRIAKQLALVPADSAAEAAVIARHRRYAELCELYGEPTVVRHAEINPAFLEARLVQVLFALDKEGEERKAAIPKSFDMYAVKGLAGRLFGLSPQKLRLVWETGEWDPVAGIDEEDEDEDEEDDKEEEGRAREGGDKAKEVVVENKNAPADADADADANLTGRWVKREVELKDSPRQFGFCVDGMEARIRVEVR
ncbi:uncharacterized protein SPSK_00735 [Sporothrix schenckii 1099-18]|uniref:CAP-Gly domain-containing protein n=1 Tax=Sporothrix schenckii 1099-18 TaxID=1397361 RepID=A0A0F2LW36_SPOSC|nr:uncharacterized protein SPSK_00735 [Sporothrix schenckii 1099-18]KJR81668.1 hypothetical protein SPSK_00735 [Sporothrix schenckii 1099-18]